MQISEEKINEYMAIFLQGYGYSIDRVRARDELAALVCLMEAVYKHNNKNNHENL